MIDKSLHDSICIITGSTSGIGKETAKVLANMGAQVILAVRDHTKAEITKREILDNNPTAKVDFILLNLASLDSVRRFVTSFRSQFDHLDILVNNAGVMTFSKKLTDDNYELSFGVNHLGHFLLTNLLMDSLKKSSSARIINVSSGAHSGGSIDLDDLFFTNKKFSAFGAYSQSKLANILFTYQLDKRLNTEGISNITVNALHPGFVRSNFAKGDLNPLFKLGYSFITLFAKSPKKGAQTSIYLACSPDVAGISGKYFVNKKEKKSSTLSYDTSLQQHLWMISKELVNL